MGGQIDFLCLFIVERCLAKQKIDYKKILKALQLTETSEEKIYEKDIQNEYAGYKNHFTFLFKATNFF